MTLLDDMNALLLEAIDDSGRSFVSIRDKMFGPRIVAAVAKHAAEYATREAVHIADYKKLMREYSRLGDTCERLTAVLEAKHENLKDPYFAIALAAPILQALSDAICDVSNEDGEVEFGQTISINVERGPITLSTVGPAREACEFSERAKPSDVQVDTDEMRDLIERIEIDEEDSDVHTFTTKVRALCIEVDRLRSRAQQATARMETP